MALFDFPLEQLKTYCPPRDEQPDFDAFWKETLDEARSYPLNAGFEQVDYGLDLLEIADVTFNGFGGQPIKGWFLAPKHKRGKLPCVVQYIGYGGGRGFPHEWTLFPNAGWSTLVMDTRGQGSSWQPGDTPDNAGEGQNPQIPGFMTRGILDKRHYYYRRVFTDAVRALEAAVSEPSVDASRIAVAGGNDDWYNRLSMRFPSLYLVQGRRSDYDNIAAADMLVIHREYSRDPLIRQAVKVAQENSTAICYTNTYNLNRFAKEIIYTKQ